MTERQPTGAPGGVTRSDDPMQFLRTRLDGRRDARLMALAESGAAAFGDTADLALDHHLAQLLRLRVAQINNCPCCLVTHHAAARDRGVPRVEVEALSAWSETDLFTDAQQAALAYAEALTRISDTRSASAFQPFHDRLVGHFDERQRLEIVAVVINMNVWTRLKLAEGARPAPRP